MACTPLWCINIEIPESSRVEFLEKFSENNFALSYAEDSTSGLLNRGGIYSRFTFENTFDNLPKVTSAKFLGSNGLISSISICLTATRTLLQRLLACLNFTLES